MHEDEKLHLGWIYLQHTLIAVASACWNFLLFLSLKTIENSIGQMRQLYVYVQYTLERAYSLLVFM